MRSTAEGVFVMSKTALRAYVCLIDGMGVVDGAILMRNKKGRKHPVCRFISRAHFREQGQESSRSF